MVDRISFHDQIQRNKIKSFVLIILIFLVFVILGYIISFVFTQDMFFFIMILSIIISFSYIIIGYYKSDKIALASVKAREVSRQEYPQFYNSVEALTIASGMPMPKLYIMENEQINAFATGRNPENSVICVTTGSLQKLNKQELEGVLAHELSHISNYDIRFMTLTAILVGMISIAAEIFLRSLWLKNSDSNNKGNIIFILIGIVFAILAPITVKLIQLAISRKREYVADASGVKFTRYPQGLINALKKIQKDIPSEQSSKKINKAVAPLFISDPFRRKFRNLLSTHPDIKERIEILERM